MTKTIENGPPAGRRRRTRLLRVRVHEAELARWQDAASQHGVDNLSRWLRAAADQAAACGQDPLGWRRQLAALQRSLNSGIGNSLDQIARSVASCPGGEACAASLSRLADDLAGLRTEVRAHLLGAVRVRRRADRRSDDGRVS